MSNEKAVSLSTLSHDAIMLSGLIEGAMILDKEDDTNARLAAITVAHEKTRRLIDDIETLEARR